MRFGNPMKRERTVATLKGHTLHFPARIPLVNGKLPKELPAIPEGARIDPEEGIVYVHVPPLVHHDVIQAGMQAEEDLPEPAQKAAGKPEDPAVLQQAAYDAFEVLVAAAERESFGANGVPKGQAVEKLLGYPLTNSEVKDLWAKFLIERQEGVDA